tara:strand:+ start:1018 stop:2166 length:1149 start_codon:yes stop_codon:yes gene_type:complete
VTNNLGNVLIRSDLNVPISNGKITDNFRIKQALSSIEQIKNISETITFCSHLGRPNGFDLNFTLEPVAEEIKKILDEDVIFINDDIRELSSTFQSKYSSKVYVLENLRFYEGEKESDTQFAQYLAKPFDTFILDAFGAAHRNHASIVEVGKHLNSYQGPLMNKEINELKSLLKSPNSPFTVIMGGAKISDKLTLINNLLPKVDNLILGGGMCFTFLKSQGYEIGASLCEDEFLNIASKLLDSSDGKKIILPVDFGVSNDLLSSARLDKSLELIESTDIGVDIGSKTVALFNEIIHSSNTIFWNGPMGVFENKSFEYGTREITKSVSQSNAYTVVGGGDSVSAINKYSEIQNFNHISTGGGASMELMEGKKLPGVNIYEPLII